MNLTYYCGGEKILSLPLFQHCIGERPRYSNAVVPTVAWPRPLPCIPCSCFRQCLLVV